MADIMFYCPNADLSVRQTLENNVQQKSDEEIYEAVLCFACTRLHFINKKTGKLLGQAVQLAGVNPRPDLCSSEPTY
jgi:hypothetical protein